MHYILKSLDLDIRTDIFSPIVKCNLTYPRELRKKYECLWESNSAHVYENVREVSTALHYTCDIRTLLAGIVAEK